MTSSAHTPTVTNATTNEDAQTTTGLVISRNSADGPEVTHFKITNIVGGKLFKHDGTTEIPVNTFITFEEGNAGLRFTPSPNNWGTLVVEIQASTSNSDAGLGGGIPARAFITVNPLGDTPSVTSASTNRNTQTSFGLVIKRNPVDSLEVTHLKITNVQNGTLFKNDGKTQISAGNFITFDEGNAGLKFTPGNNLISPSSSFGFDVQASAGGSDAGLGGSVVTSSIGVFDPITLTVNTLGDTADTNIGDGHCDTDGNLGNGDQCTLRAAIQETNSAAGDDTINFTLPPNSAIMVNTALPDLNSLTIAGPGASLLTVQRSTVGGTPDFRIFTVSSDHTVNLAGLTVSHGSAVGASFPAGLGGGILNNNGALAINNCAITGNNALSGGGIANLGALTIDHTTIASNSVTGSGGGISNSTGATQSAVLTISNSTISNNNGSSGGGVFNIGQASITNSTISTNAASTGGGLNNANPMTLSGVTIYGNSAASQGGGIYNPGIGTISFGNTIIAGNTSPAGPDASGANLISLDYNLIGNTAGAQFGGTTSHNITNVNALLGPLANNGGPTFTHGLLDGSPAIDAGNSPLTTDQRGQPRPVDDQKISNAIGGNGSDIGAYEAPTFEVNSIADTDDGACTLPGTGNGCTLREAINAANTTIGTDIITFAAPLTSGGPATITLSTVLPALSSDLSIIGPGASLLTVQRSATGGTPDFRIFTINSGKTTSISSVTISNGVASLTLGGGGVLNSGTLTLTNCILSGNQTKNGFPGGGIFNNGILTLTNSIVSANQAGVDGGASGGGISNSGTLALTNSVVNGNRTGNGATSSGGDGGGVYNGTGSQAVLVSSTISNNLTGDGVGPFHGGYGGGIFNDGTLTLAQTTVSGNQTGGPNGVPGTGGGIYNSLSASLTLTNCTITDNQTGNTGNNGFIGYGSGGGILGLSTANLKNTIVADNRIANGASGPDLSGTFNSEDYNLIGNTAGATIHGTTTHNITNVNALLGPLADNGGPTKTHALLSGSPALDAGNNAFVVNPPFSGPPFTDQRGASFNRIVDGPDADTTATVDIGAFEQQAALTDIIDQTTNEDVPILISFDIGDPAQVTSITATSDNTVLVPNIPANINVTGPSSSSTRTLTVTPSANLFGTSNITVTINNTGGSINRTFMLTVTSANDAPSFTRGRDQSVNEDSGAQTVANWVTNMSAGPPDESGQTLTFQITGNSNAGLFAIPPAINSTGTLTYSPAANANGSASITMVLKDNGGNANGGADTSAPQTFTITVNPVDDAPSFTKGPNVNVNEDAGAQTVLSWATAISAGPANESGQTLTFQITGNTNPSLFSSGPAVSATGTLTFTTAKDANGSANLTIVLKDNGGTANGGIDTSPLQFFTINVNAVNDAPSFTKGPDQTVNNNVGAQTVTNWATNIVPGPANEAGQTFNFQVTGNTNPSLFTVTPTISAIGTLTYQPATNAVGTATLTVSLRDNSGTANGGQNTSPDQTFNITINPLGGSLKFISANFATAEGSGSTTLTVTRTGELSRAVTVDYATSGNTGLPCSTAGGVASPKCDFTSALGTLSFAAGEDTKIVTVLISQDSFVEGPETFTVSLSNQTGGSVLATPSTATITINDDATEPPTNSIDDAGSFVRQHYHDFLNREPDQSGLNFWVGNISSCGTNAQCIDVARINVSAAFFLSIEFQGTGYLVERLYKTAYGDAIGTSTVGGAHQLPVPIVRLNEFLSDSQEISLGIIVGQPGWEQALENNKQAFTAEFVQRSRFTSAFPITITPAQFVDTLNANAGNPLSPSERNQLVNDLTSSTKTRAQVLRAVAEDPDLVSAEFNRAFVLMQFFGYLRRNPNDAPDSDYSGYDFWLTKLNQFNGNFQNAEMVKAFISSLEYRQRFGP